MRSKFRRVKLQSVGGDSTTHAALTIDHLAAIPGPHPRTKSEHADALDSADSTWIVHGHGVIPDSVNTR